MPIGILSLKLGTPLRMPHRRLEGLLLEARRDCCKARNAAMLHWYVWRRQHPDWQPGDNYKAPEPKIKRKPSGNGKTPKDSLLGPRLFLSRELYGEAVKAAPMLAGSLASSCAQDVIARLKSNTPYNHDGAARWQWQAILNHEVALPTWRLGVIPCPNNCCELIYDDYRCTLRFPLLSKQSGWKILSPTVRLDAGDLTRGNRRILREIADGKRKMKDSMICQAKGKWFLRLVYDVPAKANGLPRNRVLWLMPALPNQKYPFVLSYPEEDGEREEKTFGKAKPLVAEYRRVIARRRAIRYRYSGGCGKGHGQQRWYKSIRPMQRMIRDMQERWEKQFIADLLKFAHRHNCGTILYREPTIPVRGHTWFAAQDVPFRWSEFEARLANKAQAEGFDYNAKPRMGMQEWRPKEQKDAS
jgi:hypothetical protein